MPASTPAPFRESIAIPNAFVTNATDGEESIDHPHDPA